MLLGVMCLKLLWKELLGTCSQLEGKGKPEIIFPKDHKQSHLETLFFSPQIPFSKLNWLLAKGM